MYNYLQALAKFQLSHEARLELKQAKQRKQQTHTLILQWDRTIHLLKLSSKYSGLLCTTVSAAM